MNEDTEVLDEVVVIGYGTVKKRDLTGSMTSIKQADIIAVPMMIANMASGQVSYPFRLQGPVLTDVTACASGTNAIGLAARLIKHGDADVMIAGGTEAAVAKTPMAGFAAMKALSF